VVKEIALTVTDKTATTIIPAAETTTSAATYLENLHL
jgi:hypothetical protein